ncbi:PfkB family carbohydrate kinase [Maridesulfovibrio salexigens]|nr:PfkB family carbohydrate kinase [Maridesulfovibrio salexigens]
MSNIYDINTLSEIMEKRRNAGDSIVLCHGVFDLLHIGHIRYLRQAKQFGNCLVVTLTPDKYVDKGPNRPAFTEQLRAEALDSLELVDYVAINEWPTAENTLRKLKPTFYAKGSEFKDIENDPTGKIKLEAAAAKEVGTELVFTEDIVFSSSNLINRYLNVYPQELANYLEIIRKRHSPENICNYVDQMKDLKVLVIGDAIIDEYAYCNPLGISSKDPTVALRHAAKDSFAGGAVAVARHVANLAKEVTLFTTLGKSDPYNSVIFDSIPENVLYLYEEIPDAPTVRKLRYVDGYSFNKLLEIYHISDQSIPVETEQRINLQIIKIIGDYDLILVPDFGHDGIPNCLVTTLCRDAKYLAINTQANAGNRGYHTIFRYPRADFVSLAEHEIRMAYRDQKTKVPQMMQNLARKLDIETLIVSRGRNGSSLQKGQDFIQTPALAGRVVDRVGAGDALFAISSMAAYLDCPLELIGLLGNVAGAALVEHVGNEYSIDSQQIKKTITAMMK